MKFKCFPIILRFSILILTFLTRSIPNITLSASKIVEKRKRYFSKNYMDK